MASTYTIYWKDQNRLNSYIAKTEMAKGNTERLYGELIYIIQDSDLPPPNRGKKAEGSKLLIDSVMKQNNRQKEEIEELKRKLAELESKNSNEDVSVNIVQDFNKTKVIQLHNAGKKPAEIAKEIGIHHSTVRKYIGEYQGQIA